MSNFLTLIRELTGREQTRYHKDRLSNKIAKEIDDDYSIMERYIENVVDNIIRGECRRRGYSYESIKFNIDSLLYYDGDKRRVALFVALIQDYRTNIDNLEQIFFDSIMVFLRNKNLDVLINEVNVNKIQWRRDRKVSKIYREKVK